MLDSNAEHLYRNGQCMALAVAVAMAKGWQVAVWSYTGDDGDVVQHCWAIDPATESYVEVAGEHDPSVVEEMLGEEGASEDGDIIDILEPDDALKRFSRSSGLPVQDWELAQTFVEPVLERVLTGR